MMVMIDDDIFDHLDLILIRIMMLIDYDDSDDYRDNVCNDDCNDDEMVDQTQEDCLQKAQRIHPGKRCTWEVNHLDSKSIMSKNSITRQKSIICQK